MSEDNKFNVGDVVRYKTHPKYAPGMTVLAVGDDQIRVVRWDEDKDREVEQEVPAKSVKKVEPDKE